MVDISDDTKIVRRRGEVTRVVRRRRWSDEPKGRIVAEAIAPGAVIADVECFPTMRFSKMALHLDNSISILWSRMSASSRCSAGRSVEPPE
jgi:hypothetical protein